ncbi:uracil-DNA glycosylase family protein [Kineobactrum salinum]|uniref:Uracil-DNA glycosylase family protein n=1 Tax=Kineobactrum salinum TaxID=2708301 RepID=A0A6C0U226_9GAMM|nr:uracil-DNA glycosylase family protein [Kineobactrum salinum]QIB66190.1 uracil-DNA glycosylase family protein [Kineobactrum salinum]
MSSCSELLAKARACRMCEADLPLGPRPVLQLHPEAKILVVGQAPGRKVHDSGIPFDDPSGDRLRQWLGITDRQFYDPRLVALLPMGLCYPGRGKAGDLPPRPECAAHWREPLLGLLGRVQLTVVLGQYAQSWHFAGPAQSVTQRVKDWREYWPQRIPLPHPSPRNNLWLRRNPWFEAELLPALRQRVARLLDARACSHY